MNIRNKLQIVLPVCVLVVALVTGSQVYAQTQPQMLSVTFTKVKPDMAGEFVDLMKQISAANKKEGVPFFSFWQTAIFGDLYTYVSATPISKFAQYDSPSPLTKVLGEAGYQQWLARLRKCVVETTREAVMLRPDLSFTSNSNSPPKLALVAIVTVAPGKQTALEEILKSDVLPAVKKGGIKDYQVNVPVFGGVTNRYVALSLVDNFAELDKGSALIRGLGQEGYEKLRAKSVGIITQIEQLIVRYNTEVSYSLAAPGSGN